MNGSSDILTPGTALKRAKIADAVVAVLVEGDWTTGHVVDVDNHGVVLNENGDLLVFRLEAIKGVRVPRKVVHEYDEPQARGIETARPL